MFFSFQFLNAGRTKEYFNYFIYFLIIRFDLGYQLEQTSSSNKSSKINL